MRKIDLYKMAASSNIPRELQYIKKNAILLFDGSKNMDTNRWTDLIQGKTIVPKRGTPLFDADNRCITFNGSQNCACSNVYEMNYKQERTFEIVVKLDRTDVEQIMFDFKGDNYMCDGIWIVNVSGAKTLEYHPWGTGNSQNSAKIAASSLAGKIMTVTGICSPLNNMNYLYVNGLLVNTQKGAQSSAYSTTGFNFGGRTAGYGVYGSLYSFRYYDRKLTDSEIKNNHNVDREKFVL